jgi:TIR domain.
MTELFLSYSRAQKEFVTSLFHALEQEGFDSWIDWDDILPSEAWRKAIQSGIEAAHTFLFVISPASAESEVCRSEIEWAIKSHKRLIVVVREDIDASKLHPEIREIKLDILPTD